MKVRKLLAILQHMNQDAEVIMSSKDGVGAEHFRNLTHHDINPKRLYFSADTRTFYTNPFKGSLEVAVVEISAMELDMIVSQPETF